jgi:Domain of unknown function (DUF4148)
MNKRSFFYFIGTAAIAFGIFPASGAQTQSTLVTRAQVRAELEQLRAAGYEQPGGDDANYPCELRVAQARVNAMQEAARASSANAGYGRSTSGNLTASVDASAGENASSAAPRMENLAPPNPVCFVE